MTLSENIAKYRKQMGYTQDKLGKLLGVTNQAVSKWELGISMPDVMLLPKIADVLGTTLNGLYGIEDKSEPTNQGLVTAAELIIISDPVWDDGLYSNFICKDYVYLNGNTFSNELLEPMYYRDKWLEMCHALSMQTKRTVVFNSTLDSTDYYNNIGLFDSVQYVYVVSDDDTLKMRLEKAQALSKGRLENAFLKTHFWKNRTSSNPNYHTIDISGLDTVQAAVKLQQFIRGIIGCSEDFDDCAIEAHEKVSFHIIDDFFEPMKSGIYSALLSKEKNYIVLNGKPFCNVVSGPSYYRNVWLEICKSIFIQTNKSIVLFGSLSQEVILENSEEIIADVQWIHIVSSDEKVIARCKETGLKNTEIALQWNQFQKDNITKHGQCETLLDITDISNEKVAEIIDRKVNG